ncbi:MAG: PVC-type heme-binding CxxCH protein [Cyclobacteriaceae bacterium]
MKPASSFIINFFRTSIPARYFLSLVLAIISILFVSCSGNQGESDQESMAAQLGLHVPEGFIIEQAMAPGMVKYPMFATLDNQGRLFVIESSGKTTSTEDVLKNPTFQILLLEDIDRDGIYDKRNVFADKIPYPMGGTFYQGSFYAAAPPDLIRFTDTDADGISDKREVLLTGWTLNHNAATLSGPFFGPDGWMYMCDARRGFNIRTKEGTELKGKGARIWRCRPDGTGLEWVSGGGFDNSVELIFMPAGETIGTITYFTDPQDGFRDALMHWVEGGVYPKPFSVIEEDRLKLTGPLMPVMTTLARVSPAGLMRYRGTSLGKEYKGNLFSAQFNTGRIMRHIITPVGATFSTTEEVFMNSDSMDIHPTDVLEDADGSLLVVNTGGWFIAGCPLSVVARTDVHGDIFRIRKKDSFKLKDPWGRNVDFTDMSADELTGLMNDSRPMVRENATEHLIGLGEQAVGSLTELLTSSDDEEERTAAVFALSRVHTPDAMVVVFSSLEDKSAMVRTAAARVLGITKERIAVDKLMTLVVTSSASVRRQAATALGQIGDKRAIPALLKASENADDRFVEHAIIYSLITLGDGEPIVQALNHPDENVRNTALIALDQIANSPLKKSDLLPFLQGKNAQLQNTGIWVVSHHPEWADVVISYLEDNLKNATFTEYEKKLFTDLLKTFSTDRHIQNYVSGLLAGAATPEEKKLFLLEVIRQYPSKSLPDSWIRQLGNLLRGKNAVMRSEVLDLIQSRSIPEFNKELENIFMDPQNSKAFQLKALNARIMSRPGVSDAEFRKLLNLTSPEEESPIRQSAVRILSQAELNDKQLLLLAKDAVHDADIFLLPDLVSAFEGTNNEEVGHALIAALPSSTDRLDYLSVESLNRLIKNFPPAVRVSAEPLLNTLNARQATRLSALQKIEATLKGGDVGEGRKLFFEKALCSTCHSIIGQGGDFGPDLTNIGEIRSQHDLLEAIVYPNASFAREYETSRVVTKTATYAGIIKEQWGETIVLETGPGIRVRLSRKEINSIEPQDVSLMPPGLHQQLTTGELSDLMAYLSSLPDGMGHLKVASGDQ